MGAALAMGADESKQAAIKPILKHQKSESVVADGLRRFSAPVIYGKGGPGERTTPDI